ncbi:UNVERIFIED_CONTAM: hypothetical protein Sradi_6215000 [Sesamum radiatum]|uniref:Reverse transcriptase zinc-binding domain-containing protein n=1 Tax=Sesamum radiatum TaxID=300843 RepID=A0AAW2K9W4_SESRA
MVDASMRDDLLQPLTATEVTKALFQMALLKSSGPNDRIISPSQSAFVPDRLISDNILLAFELNHFLNSKTRGEQSWMVLKLDVSKAYDKVEWSFLQQGIPSGGPLSPYLFLLCTESFSSLLQNTEHEDRLRGLAVCRVLENYRCASSQEINFSKSSVTFSKNTKEELCRDIKTELTIWRENKMELYLGLPSRVSRSKRDLFATIWDSIWSKITGKHKIHWPLWNSLCESKLVGGLGFRQLHLFNLAMLAKHLWRIMLHPESLLSRVLKARCFPMADVFIATLGSRHSFTWRSIMAAHDLFYVGCRWRVDSRMSIRVWANLWMPLSRTFRPITPTLVSSIHLRVSDLMDPHGHVRDVPKIRSLFWHVDSELMSGILLSRTDIQDLRIWHYSRSKMFSIRSAYHLACSLEDLLCSSSLRSKEHTWWRKLWLAKLPSKVKVFVWRACLNALPTMQPECMGVGDWLLTVSAWMDGCVGVFARGAAGECLAWASKRIHSLGNGEMAEALAAREAILLTTSKDWALFVSRSCNVVTHALAQSGNGSLEGDSVFPPELASIVIANIS